MGRHRKYKKHDSDDVRGLMREVKRLKREVRGRKRSRHTSSDSSRSSSSSRSRSSSRISSRRTRSLSRRRRVRSHSPRSHSRRSRSRSRRSPSKRSLSRSASREPSRSPSRCSSCPKTETPSKEGTVKDKNSNEGADKSGETSGQISTSVEGKIVSEGSTPLVLDEKRLGVLGKDPATSDTGEVKLNPDLVSRCDFWLRNGLPTETKEELLKKYPRKCNFLLEAPEVNPVMLLSMGESSVKRDEHFQNMQRLAGSALSALGQGMNMLLSEEGLDAIKLLEFLSDCGKLVTQLHHAETIARRAFIAPAYSKSVKSILDKSNRGTFLFGDDLTEKINEISSLEKISKTLKPSFPAKKPAQNYGSLNMRSSSSRNQRQSWASNNQNSQSKKSAYQKPQPTSYRNQQVKMSTDKLRPATRHQRK